MTALTRLTLTQRLGRWSGTKDPSEITSTTAIDTLHVGNLVAFVDQAWLDIQLAQNSRWQWMRRQLLDTKALTASTKTLAMSVISATCRTIVPFINHDMSPQRYILLTHPVTDTVHKVEFVPYEYWRGYYDRGARQTNKPTHFTLRPDNTAEFDPIPDAAYTINCDWITLPTELTADATEPDMPDHFHMLIVWWAMVHLMDFDEKASRYVTANRQYKKMLNRLTIEQLAEDMHGELLSTRPIY